MKKVIKLVTPKGEEILVNFKNVSYCTVTSNNCTSLRFNNSVGKANVGSYLIVADSIDQIKNKLNGHKDALFKKEEK